MATDRSLLSLTMTFLESDMCEEQAKKGQAEFEALSPPNPRQLNEVRTGSVDFLTPQENLKRFIYAHPDYMDAVMALSPEDLKYVWTNFFGSFTRKRKIDYNEFKPIWLDSQTVFVVGKEKTRLHYFPYDRMFRHHDIRSNDSRTTAKCILVSWSEREVCWIRST